MARCDKIVLPAALLAAAYSSLVSLTHLHRTVRRGLNGLTFAEGRAAIRQWTLPAFEHQAILRSIRPSLVVDVGANRGQFSLDVRRALPGARVVAFEPLALEAAVYRKIFATTPTHELHCVAVGAQSGSASLHVSAERTSSSLLPIGERQSQFFPGTHEVGTEAVDVRPLDDFADRFGFGEPALLKIDVQGAELEVVAGAEATLSRFRWIYLEMSFVELYGGQPLAHEVVAELRARGFELTSTGIPWIIGDRPVQVDAMFERCIR